MFKFIKDIIKELLHYFINYLYGINQYHISDSENYYNVKIAFILITKILNKYINNQNNIKFDKQCITVLYQLKKFMDYLISNKPISTIQYNHLEQIHLDYNEIITKLSNQNQSNITKIVHYQICAVNLLKSFAKEINERYQITDYDGKIQITNNPLPKGMIDFITKSSCIDLKHQGSYPDILKTFSICKRLIEKDNQTKINKSNNKLKYDKSIINDEYNEDLEKSRRRLKNKIIESLNLIKTKSPSRIQVINPDIISYKHKLSNNIYLHNDIQPYFEKMNSEYCVDLSTNSHVTNFVNQDAISLIDDKLVKNDKPNTLFGEVRSLVNNGTIKKWNNEPCEHSTNIDELSIKNKNIHMYNSELQPYSEKTKTENCIEIIINTSNFQTQQVDINAVSERANANCQINENSYVNEMIVNLYDKDIKVAVFDNRNGTIQ